MYYKIEDLENEELLELREMFSRKVWYLGSFDEKENETLDTYLEIEDELTRREANQYA